MSELINFDDSVKIVQIDGNDSLLSSVSDECQNSIPIHISQYRHQKVLHQRRKPVLKSVKRRNLILDSIQLPVVMNINPRSIYNKTEDFKLLLDQYDADVVCMSESWERDNLSLKDLLNLENYSVITNVLQREGQGGKPAILVNKEKFHVKHLCPEPITVPVGVECVWALITPRNLSPRSQIQHIAVAAVYYNGPKSMKKQELYDHIAESFHFLLAKYTSKIHFLICGDTNRLPLSPILNLSPDLKQQVKVFTRLNPPAILDPIITTLSKWYQPPISMPPVDANPGEGVPSDHLVVLMSPLVSELQSTPRVYRTVVTRPLNRAGFERFASWVENYEWKEIFESDDANQMANTFQTILLKNYEQCFPTKTIKVCNEDQPWISSELKQLNRKVKREFCKNKKSKKWLKLKQEFDSGCRSAKEKYYSQMVEDLKNSNPAKWYSKIKRMAGIRKDQAECIFVDELDGYSNKEQAEKIAKHYSEISNSYEPIDDSEFAEYLDRFRKSSPVPVVEPRKIHETIRRMNKRAAVVQNDVPMKVISEFSVELAFPLSHIFNCCLKTGTYPDIWKIEAVTPVPKVFPPEQLKDLRKISGLLNIAKIMDKIVAEFLVSDMSSTRDLSQYGNEKNLSSQHYLINMIHKVLTATDRNSQSEAIAVVANMIDWAQAFDRQSHQLGIKSFIENGVRPSLIPILISFFKDRMMRVKWNGEVSQEYPLNGGSPQGDVLGILEYLSQTNHNTDFLDADEKFKFIDDLTFLEIINLIMKGLCSYNVKAHVPSDVHTENQILPAENFRSQEYLNKINSWTENHLMKLNPDKSQFMIFNYTNIYQFNTRLSINAKPIEQVHEKKLLGVIINDQLTWDSNTDFIVKRAYKRMSILHNLYSFGLPLDELINIYILYIRSVVEYCAVVWHSSLTVANELAIERVQKVALRIILKDDYLSYSNALKITSLKTLKDRRVDLCLNFARKSAKKSKNRSNVSSE